MASARETLERERLMGELRTLATTKNGDAIELCEGLLERLRSGESVSIAFVEVKRSRVVATAWSKSDTFHFLNSGAAILATRIASETD